MVQIEEVPDAPAQIQMQTVSVPLQLSDATVTQLATTNTVPPKVVACGYSKKMQAWGGADAGDDRVGFRPAHSYAPEAEKVRVSHVLIDDRILMVGDSATYGTITIFEIVRWTELQKLEVSDDVKDNPDRGPQSIASMKWDGQHLAVGTKQGELRTWKQPQKNTPYVRFLDPLRVDSQPVEFIHLSGRELLVAYSPSKFTMVVWSLEDGRLRNAWNSTTLCCGKPLTHSAMGENLLVSIHQELGSADLPSVQLLDAMAGDGGRIPSGEMTKEDGDVTALAFDTARIVCGFSTGAVVAWEIGDKYKSWKKYHGGAVGSMQMVPGTAQLLTGGADRNLCLWDAIKGELLGRVELGGQITALECSQDKFVAVGTARGFVEVVMLPGANTECQVEGDVAARFESRARPAIEYDLFFEDASGMPLPKKGNIKAFHQMLHEEGGAPPPPPKPAATEKNGSEEKAGSGKTSSNGLKGAFSSKEGTGLVSKEEEERAAEEAAGRGTSRPEAVDMPGTARDANFKLNSHLDTVRKCSSLNCIAKEIPGTGKKFLRCGKCKQVFYCSQHCQRTHWRDEHKKKCCVDEEPAE